MMLSVIIREMEERGYWVEVHAIPGCVTQSETFDELFGNIYEAIEGWLCVDYREVEITEKDKVIEISV